MSIIMKFLKRLVKQKALRNNKASNGKKSYSRGLDMRLYRNWDQCGNSLGGRG